MNHKSMKQKTLGGLMVILATVVVIFLVLWDAYTVFENYKWYNETLELHQFTAGTVIKAYVIPLHIVQEIRIIIVLCQITSTLASWATQYLLDAYLIGQPISVFCFTVVASATFALSMTIDRYEQSLNEGFIEALNLEVGLGHAK